MGNNHLDIFSATSPKEQYIYRKLDIQNVCIYEYVCTFFEEVASASASTWTVAGAGTDDLTTGCLGGLAAAGFGGNDFFCTIGTGAGAFF